MSVMSYNITQQGVKVKTPMASNENKVGGAPHNGTSNNHLRKTFSKITVQNVLSENIGNSANISNNNENTIVRKIKDFGMIGTVTNASGITSLSSSSLNSHNRKRPITEEKTNTENGSQTPVTKKSKTMKEVQKPKVKRLGECNQKQKVSLSVRATAVTTPVRPVGTPGRKGLPLPQAVARRNARERNRVKQVNNGFAALRERIPEEVAEAFEAQGNGRGTAKKLSKVETLRMAVEYIRSLESILGFKFPTGGCGMSGQYRTNTSIGAQSNSSSGEDSFTMIKDEFDDLSPGLEDHFEDSLNNYDVDDYFGTPPINSSMPTTENDMLPNITTLNGLTYLRIPGTNTYQLVTTDVLSGDSMSPSTGCGGIVPLGMSLAADDDNEKFSTLIDTNCLSPDADASGIELNSSTSPTPMKAKSSSASCLTTTTTTAPATINGACVDTRSSLSSSPVPLQQQRQHQQQSPSPSSSPANTSLHQGDQPAILSPAANELSLQSCATVVLTEDSHLDHREFMVPTPPQQQHHHQQVNNLQSFHSSSQGMIKQEFAEVDFVNSPALPSPSGSTLIYHTHDQQKQQTQQRQGILGHASLSTSPPLDIGVANSGGNPTVLLSSMQTDGLQSFYDQDPHSSATHTFYEGVNIAAFKKDLGNVLLDSTSNSNALSDESMIEAIDWWEAHTPKSDSNSVIL